MTELTGVQPSPYADEGMYLFALANILLRWRGWIIALGLLGAALRRVAHTASTHTRIEIP